MTTRMPTGITINKQHEYISIKLGNNRSLTVSFSGVKATGKVPDFVFDAWDKATKHDGDMLAKLGLDVSASLGDILKAFAAYLPTLWPDWDKAPKVPNVGDKVTLDFGKRRGKEEGIVQKVRSTTVTAIFPINGLVSFPADMLEA